MSLAHPLVAIMRLSLKRLKFQVSQAQLSGVQECRSDASLRSVDDSVACIVKTIVYTPASYTPATSLLAKLELKSLMFLSLDIACLDSVLFGCCRKLLRSYFDWFYHELRYIVAAHIVLVEHRVFLRYGKSLVVFALFIYISDI